MRVSLQRTVMGPSRFKELTLDPVAVVSNFCRRSPGRDLDAPALDALEVERAADGAVEE